MSYSEFATAVPAALAILAFRLVRLALSDHPTPIIDIELVNSALAHFGHRLDFEALGNVVCLSVLLLPLFFLLACHSLEALPARVSSHPAALFTCGIFRVLFAIGSYGLLYLTCRNVGPFDNVANALISNDESFRAALASEYVKLRQEYEVQVETIGTLVLSLRQTCKGHNDTVRGYRNGSVFMLRRPLFGSSPDFDFREYREPFILIRLYRNQDARAVWLQQQLDCLQTVVLAKDDHIHHLRSEVQRVQMAIVDLPSMIAEDTRKRSSNAATPYQQDPCSFRAALHPRRDKINFVQPVQGHTFLESRFCRTPHSSGVTARPSEWILPLHALMASRQQAQPASVQEHWPTLMIDQEPVQQAHSVEGAPVSLFQPTSDNAASHVPVPMSPVDTIMVEPPALVSDDTEMTLAPVQSLGLQFTNLPIAGNFAPGFASAVSVDTGQGVSSFANPTQPNNAVVPFNTVWATATSSTAPPAQAPAQAPATSWAAPAAEVSVTPSAPRNAVIPFAMAPATATSSTMLAAKAPAKAPAASVAAPIAKVGPSTPKNGVIPFNVVQEPAMPLTMPVAKAPAKAPTASVAAPSAGPSAPKNTVSPFNTVWAAPTAQALATPSAVALVTPQRDQKTELDSAPEAPRPMKRRQVNVFLPPKKRHPPSASRPTLTVSSTANVSFPSLESSSRSVQSATPAFVTGAATQPLAASSFAFTGNGVASTDSSLPPLAQPANPALKTSSDVKGKGKAIAYDNPIGYAKPRGYVVPSNWSMAQPVLLKLLHRIIAVVGKEMENQVPPQVEVSTIRTWEKCATSRADMELGDFDDIPEEETCKLSHEECSDYVAGFFYADDNGGEIQHDVPWLDEERRKLLFDKIRAICLNYGIQLPGLDTVKG